MSLKNGSNIKNNMTTEQYILYEVLTLADRRWKQWLLLLFNLTIIKKLTINFISIFCNIKVGAEELNILLRAILFSRTDTSGPA